VGGFPFYQSKLIPDILYNDEIQKTRETYYREAKVLGISSMVKQEERRLWDDGDVYGAAQEKEHTPRQENPNRGEDKVSLISDQLVRFSLGVVHVQLTLRFR